MIDYIDLLNKSCPEEVVEYVLAADPATIPAMLWPNNDPFGSDYDNACHSAVIGYYSRGIGPNSSWDWDTAYVQDFMDVVLTGDILKKDERAPDEVRQAFARALERLAATDKRLVPYGAMTATFFTGLGCLMGPSVLYLALLAVTG